MAHFLRKSTWVKKTYNDGKHLGTCKIRAEELEVWRARLTCLCATFDESEGRAVERHDGETILMSQRIEGIFTKRLRKVRTMDV
jgi:hypothetical protein